MSNDATETPEGGRIDLTQFEGCTTPWDFGKKYPHIESAKVAVELIAELKRCYEELDFLKENVLTDDDYWIATCKPDGEGQCSLTIEGYKELMRLVKENQVEIPEYSHGHDELLLYACKCGITHDEWLESKK